MIVEFNLDFRESDSAETQLREFPDEASYQEVSEEFWKWLKQTRAKNPDKEEGVGSWAVV